MSPFILRREEKLYGKTTKMDNKKIKKEMLLENLGAQIFEACAENNVEFLKNATEKLGNKILTMPEKDTENWTPVHEAVARGSLEVIKFLAHTLEKEFLNSSVSRFFLDALHFACENGNYEIVKFLVDFLGEQVVLHPSEDGLTCLEMASNAGRVEIAEFLAPKIQAETEKKINELLILAKSEKSNIEYQKTLYPCECDEYFPCYSCCKPSESSEEE